MPARILPASERASERVWAIQRGQASTQTSQQLARIRLSVLEIGQPNSARGPTTGVYVLLLLLLRSFYSPRLPPAWLATHEPDCVTGGGHHQILWPHPFWAAPPAAG